MKKLFFFLMVVLTAVFVSCSSDDDDNQSSSNPLVGTTWTSENLATYVYSGTAGKDYEQVLYFKSSTKFDFYYREIATGKKGDAGDITNEDYAYMGDSIVFSKKNGNLPKVLYFKGQNTLCNHKDESESFTYYFYKAK